MKYSIVTIGYKSLQNIINCIGDAYNSSIPPEEFVVVINPYDDQTKAIVDYVINENKITRWAYMSQNVGCAKAFNIGFSLCRGDFIVALSDDCRVGPNTYKKMIQEFKNEEIGVVGVKAGGNPEDKYMTAQGFLLAYRKEMILEIGGYSELASPLACEREFGLRAKYHNWGTKIAPDCEWFHNHDISANPDSIVNYMGRACTAKEFIKEFSPKLDSKRQFWANNI